MPLDADADARLYLKLETLQPVNSFKIRGAGNAVLQATRRGARRRRRHRERREHGAGRGLRGAAARRPRDDRRPRRRARDEDRRDRALRRAGRCAARTTTGGACSSRATTTARDGLFIHPVDDVRVMAGNGTIGLEILEDLPDVDAIVVPYGGGGLISGIASAVKATRPEVRMYAVEPETGAPAASALHGGPRPGRLHPVVRRRRREPLADRGCLGACARADRRRVHGLARRRGCRHSADRRARCG